MEDQVLAKHRRLFPLQEKYENKFSSSILELNTSDERNLKSFMKKLKLLLVQKICLIKILNLLY